MTRFSTSINYRNAEMLIGISGYGQWTVRGIFNGRQDAQVQLHWTNAGTIDDLKGQGERRYRVARKWLYECLLWEYHKHYGRVLPCTYKVTQIVINGVTMNG